MARFVKTSFGPAASSLSESDVKGMLEWEYIGFDNASNNGVTAYSTDFNRSQYIGYKYFMYGKGNNTAVSSIYTKFRVNGSESNATSYSYTTEWPANYTYHYAATQNAFITYQTFYAYANGHNPMVATVYMTNPMATNFQLELLNPHNAASGYSTLWGVYSTTSTTDLVDGMRIYNSSGHTILIDGGVYKFGLRRR